jgi:hypothetical protein
VSNNVSNSVNTNDAFLDRTNNRHPRQAAQSWVAQRTTQPEPVRWWIPLVASTGALLVLVLGTAAVVSSLVNATISNIG